MEARRYQRGSLTLQKRKSLPDAWVFRYYVEEKGHRVYKKQLVGTVLEFPKRKDAEKAIAHVRININEGAEFVPMNIEQLVAHYKRVELPRLAPSTQQVYCDNFKNHILPHWGEYSLASIRPIEVENWLRELRGLRGKDASPSVKSKVRNLLHVLFSHALRYEFGSRNPITSVRSSSQRLRDPEFLDGNEFQALIAKLDQRERVMVLIAGSTGMRRSELIGLRWKDINFPFREAKITRSMWRNKESNCKTRASRKPVPLHPFVLDQLQDWRRVSPWNGDGDFVFPSVRLNGKNPISPDMVLRRSIRPVLKALGVDKHIGWHSFRHGLGTMLRQQGVDLKIAQELLRHANSRVTMEIYQQAVSAEKHSANALAVRGLLGDSVLQHPKAPSEVA
ncbi:MAG: site-specific integrase [Silvibacterium sp.]